MKNLKKRILSIALAIVVLCCPLLNVSGSAHAVTPGEFSSSAVQVVDEFIAKYGAELGPIILTLGEYALGALGLAFLSQGQKLIATSEFVNSNPVIGEYLSVCGAVTSIGTDGAFKWFPTQVELKAFAKVVEMAADFFGVTKTAIDYAVTDDLQGVIGTATFTYLTTFASAQEAYAYAPYSFKDITSSEPFTLTVNGVAYDYYIASGNGDGINFQQLYLNGLPVCDTNGYNIGAPHPMQLPGGFGTWVDCRMGFRFLAIAGTNYLLPYFACSYVDTVGTVHYFQKVSDTLAVNRGAVPVSGIGIDELVISEETLKYQHEITFSISEMLQALQTKIDSLTEAIEITLDREWEDVQEGDDEEEQYNIPLSRWATILASLGILDLIKTLQQSTSITESDFDTPEMPVNLKDKFPFCVPFDLIALVTALNAPAEVPSATIPLKFASLGYESSMTINLSQFEGVARAVRWGTTILFIFGLIVLTRKLIKG